MLRCGSFLNQEKHQVSATAGIGFLSHSNPEQQHFHWRPIRNLIDKLCQAKSIFEDGRVLSILSLKHPSLMQIHKVIPQRMKKCTTIHVHVVDNM